MTKAPIGLQELRRRISHKATSEPTHRFWGLCVHGTKSETLHEAYRVATRNGGAAGIDGETFDDIEAAGRWTWLAQLQQELGSGHDQPQANRRVEIPKGKGTFRVLHIPCIRDRVVQGALKLILESIFEADFCDNSSGYRPKRSPQRALASVRRSLLRRRSTVVDVDLSNDFDSIRHAVLLAKIARRVQDPHVLHLIKQIIKGSGPVGVPQGGPLSPLAANISLNEADWAFDAIRRQTAQGTYEAVNDHRFSDDIVITVSGHHSKRGWAQRALQRLQELLAPLGVGLNLDKTQVVDTLKGGAFGFVGFDLRRVRKRQGTGFFILMMPKKSARLASKARIRESIRYGGATPIKQLITRINQALVGWVHYFRWGNSNRAFSEMRDEVETKVRTLLTRRKRRRKRSIGWRRWSNASLYGVLGLFWDWKVRRLPSAASYE
jgi:RNA-directed DNA polymerase